MKNFDLEHFGVVEMNQQEMKQTDGGIWPYIIGALIGAAFTQDLDRIVNSFNEGYEAGHGG